MNCRAVTNGSKTRRMVEIQDLLQYILVSEDYIMLSCSVPEIIVVANYFT